MKPTYLPVLLISFTLTAFIAGSGAAYFVLQKSFQKKLDDPQFVQSIKPAEKQQTRNRPPALVRVETARKEMINTVRPFYGKLAEVQIAKISTEVSGLVIDLPVEVGYKVKGKETLIAQIDKTWLELSAKQTEAEIKILERQYEYQLSELKRAEQLAGRAVTESDLDNQRMTAEQYRQNLEKAKIAHEETKERIRRSTIVAPFDGYVIRRLVGLGELLSPGTPIAEIVSLGSIDAVVNIAEEFINHVSIGEEMPIIIDQLGIKVAGKVHSIVPYDIHAATRSFPVIVRLEDRGGELKAGMSATALVSITDLNEEIIVAKNAVLSKPDGNVVWIAAETTKEDGTVSVSAQPVPVQITAENIGAYGVRPETEEGKRLLVTGAKTIIEGAERLTGNQQIRIAAMDPKLMENLPPATGHREIPRHRKFN
ncbi:MAG: efflux RND transporter periplasmic adaptor subunit [Planctomycetaceae bacterium]|jgi:RND family efflux transporter MFP subunit|nr:efflux RND transporter periplasmic adaptor subunit [Planctomycetaceae bacterium]